MYHDVKWVYTDGGLIGPNPSKIGGTYAWRWLNGEGEVVGEASGVILTDYLEVDAVTNNITELYALADALELLPTGWSGTICSDSKIALGWAFKGYNQRLAHPSSCIRLAQAIERFGEVQTVLLGGHPSKKDLERGINADGSPVSQHNLWCDKECSRLSKEYVTQNPERILAGVSRVP